jgi:hypothetical protein
MLGTLTVLLVIAPPPFVVWFDAARLGPARGLEDFQEFPEHLFPG